MPVPHGAFLHQHQRPREGHGDVQSGACVCTKPCQRWCTGNDHTIAQLQELEDLLYGPRSVQRARTDQEMVVCLLLTHKLEAATSLQLHVLEVLKEKLDPEDIQLAKAYAATCTTLQASGYASWLWLCRCHCLTRCATV